MPEAAIDKYSHLGDWKDDIRLSAQLPKWSSVDKVAKALSMQFTSHCYLRARVPSCLPAHLLMDGFGYGECLPPAGRRLQLTWMRHARRPVGRGAVVPSCQAVPESTIDCRQLQNHPGR